MDPDPGRCFQHWPGFSLSENSQMLSTSNVNMHGQYIFDLLGRLEQLRIMAQERFLTHIERGAKGGDARAAKLSTNQKKAIGRLAAEARWGGDLPQASHDGPLPIGNAVLAAAVLPNGKRLLSQGTFLKALGRSRTPKAGTGGIKHRRWPPLFLAGRSAQAVHNRRFKTVDHPHHF